MLVDMHVHTNISSRCSSLKPQELVDRALELGLDAVCVTEHATFKGAQVMHEIALERGFKVFRGMEVFTELGDMLVFGWEENVRFYLFPFQDLKTEVEKRGGIIIPAHPCRGLDPRHKHQDGLPEELLSSVITIETHNGLISRKSNEQAEKVREQHGLFGIGGSDAHHVTNLGECVTIFEECPTDEKELMEALRGGRYHGAYLEDVRPEELTS